VVSVKTKDPVTGNDMIRSVNSVLKILRWKGLKLKDVYMNDLNKLQCMVPVFSADGWDITTVEGIGDQRKGYHKIQDQIVKFSGTQCGFCTPGMVMNMYR
jgi:xanthine dehydrogenase iron-sulfur cluster and FAD-binding subunit A